MISNQLYKDEDNTHCLALQMHLERILHSLKSRRWWTKGEPGNLSTRMDQIVMDKMMLEKINLHCIDLSRIAPLSAVKEIINGFHRYLNQKNDPFSERNFSFSKE